MKNSIKKICSMLVLFMSVLAILNVMQTAEVFAASSSTTAKHVIVLDPGHSGTSVGASSVINGVTYKEEVITWKIAGYIQQELAKYPNIEVHLTRSAFSPNNSLVDRVQVAANYEADLLVSLHIDSSDSSSPKGASLLISNGNYRSELAEKERIFGSYLQTQLKSIGLNWRGYYLRNSENGSLYPNGKIRDYYGIVASSIENNVPGVIIEHCFITNASDVSNYLSSDAKIQKLAIADANAIVEYCKNVTPNSSVVKNGWYQSGSDYYYYQDGTLVKNKLLKLSDGIYYVDANGKRVTGWKTISKKKYYFASDGKATKGWKTISGKKYYFSSTTGVMFQSTLNTSTTSGAIRYFGSDGALAVNQWVTYNNKTYYMNSAGQAVKGFVKISGKTYYFVSGGSYLCRDKKLINSKGYVYYIDKDGVRAENKFVVLTENKKSVTYYFGSNGVAYTGWHTINGKKYYFTKTGKMAQSCSLTNSKGLVSVFNSNGVCTKQYYKNK